MSVRGYEETYECPYNQSHQILKHRFQTHLVKCRKSYPDVHKVVCPFSAVHLINEPELAYHIKECPNRASFDTFKYNMQTGVKSEAVPANYEVVQSEECWDDEDVPTYDPQKYVENAPVLRTLNLEAPAVRNAFREAERRRLNGIMTKTEK